MTSGMNLGLSVTSERIGRQYVYLDISGIWDNILGHFGPKIGLFGPKTGLLGPKIGQKIGLFGLKNGLFGHFFGHFGPKIGFFGKNGQTGLLLSFAALSVIFCVSRFTNTISRWRES